MIYLASPYSNPDPRVRRERYRQAFFYTALRMTSGHTIFSPIVYGHDLAETYDLGTDYAFWADLNERILATATSVEVLMLDGWRASDGIRKEIEIANRLSIPVTYVQKVGDARL